MVVSIAEEVLLLLLDDDSGKLRATSSIDALLGGALLTELAILGAAEVSSPEGLLRRRRVRATARTPDPSDPVLRNALDRIRERDRSPADLVPRLGRRVKDELLHRLAAGGAVRLENDRVLGVFPRNRWPAQDATHEREIRARVDRVLAGGEPDERTAALIALLHAVDLAHKVVDHKGVSRKEAGRRAKEVAAGDWAAGAVKEAVQSAQAAIAVTIAATAGAAAGS